MAPSQKSNSLVFRFKVGLARRVLGRKSAKILVKMFIGDQGVEVLNQVFELCKILVGGDQKEANHFIDRSIRILTDCAMYSIEQKFTEGEMNDFVCRVNHRIAEYNRVFEVIQESSPGFNAVEIPKIETSQQKEFRGKSQKFIADVTKIFVETMGHHFDAGTIRCIHKISHQLRAERTLNQLCYHQSPATLQMTQIAETVVALELELTQRGLNSNLEALCSKVPKISEN